MKKSAFLFCAFLLTYFTGRSQQVTDGPEIYNPTNRPLTQYMDGDDNSFYTYRLKAKGDNEPYSVIEKYDKNTLQQIYSKKLDPTNIEDILTVGGKVYVFYHKFFEQEKLMSVYFQELSPEGVLLPDIGEMMSVQTEKERYADFEITQTPDKSKFLVRVSYRATKDDSYQTDFVFMDSRTFKPLLVKSVQQRFVEKYTAIQNFFGQFSKDIQSLSFFTDNETNIYYGYTCGGWDGSSGQRDNRIVLMYIAASEASPKTLEIPLTISGQVGEFSNKFSNIKFVKTGPDELVAGGFFKSIERLPGRDAVSGGMCAYTIDLKKMEVKAQAASLFDAATLEMIAFDEKKSHDMFYRVDYLFPSGNSVFMVGEQYFMHITKTYASHGTTMVGAGGTMHTYGGGGGEISVKHEYMDVLVIKYDPAGKFEWIRNTPLRHSVSNHSTYSLKVYTAFATDNKIFILNNESTSNTAKVLKPGYKSKSQLAYSSTSGTNFVCSSISMSDGAFDHKLVFQNKTFLFEPATNAKMQRMFVYGFNNFGNFNNSDTRLLSESAETIFQSKNNIFVYTHQKTKDRFTKLKFD